MSAEPKDVFISFAYKDGLALAQELNARLRAEGITTWFEREDMKGGEDWKRQITLAMDQVRLLLLVLTREAQDSEWVRWEWRHARNRRVHIAPVIPDDPDLKPDLTRLPSWIRSCDLWKDPSDRERLVLLIKSRPSPPLRAPFAVPDKPRTYVHRNLEYDALRNLLLDEKRENPVAITTAIQGGGGFGKSTLARALCHDEDIFDAFTDGIVWVELGAKAQEADVVRCLGEIYRSFLSEEPGFGPNATAAAARLWEKLWDRSALIVIDDVWHRTWLEPFLQGAPQCARLFTTRNPAIVADVGAVGVAVDRMSSKESIELLRNQIAERHRSLADSQDLGALAQQVGEMPLLLELSGKAINKQLPLGKFDVARAVAVIADKLRRKGVIALDMRNEAQRSYSISKTIELSLEFLDPPQREQAHDLGILQPETVIPSSTLQALWGFRELDDARDLATTLGDSGLVTASAEGIRLHDVVAGYLSLQLGAHISLRHNRLIDAWGDPHELPDEYAWGHYAHHLAEAGRLEELKPLFFDYTWLRAKFRAVGAIALRDDATRFPDDRDCQLLARALEQSAHILAKDPEALRGQLCGHLIGMSSPRLEGLLEQVRRSREKVTWLRPLLSGLVTADSPQVRTWHVPAMAHSKIALTPDGCWAVSSSWHNPVRLWDRNSAEGRELGGHDYVNSVSISPDGRWSVSGSQFGTVQLWDRDGGEGRELGRHDSPVKSVSVSGEGRCVASGSADGTVCLWVRESGESRELGRHAAEVDAVAVSDDGRWVVSGSLDGSVRLWHREGGEGRVLGRHRAVISVWASSDGRWVVSGSYDGTVRLWDCQAGEWQELGRHEESVNSVAASRDGRWVVSGSYDSTVRLWDCEAREWQELGRHEESVDSVAVSGDGRWAASGSSDGMVRLWDLESAGRRELSQQANPVYSVSVSGNGRWATSGSSDGTVRLWSLAGEWRELGRHASSVNAVSMSGDGRWVVSGSHDGAVWLWDREDGGGRELDRHPNSVFSVSVSSDGRWVVSGSYDRILRVWDRESGEWRKLGRHYALDSSSMSRDGRWVVSGSYDGTVRLWDREGGEPRVLDRDAWGDSVAVSGDGRRVVSGSSSGAVRLWDEEGGKWRELARQESPVRCVAVSGDGRWILASSKDGAVRLWDLTSTDCPAAFYADAAASACAISEDGSIIAAGDLHGGVHLLKREDGFAHPGDTT